MKREDVIGGANWVSIRGGEVRAYDKRGRKVYVIKGGEVKVREVRGRGNR